MNEKSKYTSPNCLVVRMTASGSLLTASVPFPGTIVLDDFADEYVMGLSRRRGYTVWDDEEDEDNY